MPEPLFLIGILSKIAGKAIVGKAGKDIAVDATEDGIKDLVDAGFKKGISKIKEIWKKDKLPENNALSLCIREAKLYATDLLIKTAAAQVTFLESLDSPFYSGGTAKALDAAWQKWHTSQTSDKVYTPYLPEGDAAFEKLEQLLLSSASAGDNKAQVVTFIKQQFYAELSYGLGLQGFDRPMSAEVGTCLYEGWEMEGRHVDWYDILTLRLLTLLQAPENEKAQKAFSHHLLSDIKVDTQSLLTNLKEVSEKIDRHSEAIERKIEELCRQTGNKLSAGILRRSEDVLTLLRRKETLETAVMERREQYEVCRQRAEQDPSRESVIEEVKAENVWLAAANALQQTENELTELEQFIKSAGDIFGRMNIEKGSSRLKMAKDLFEEGQFSKVRAILSSAKREDERDFLRLKEEEIHAQRRNLAAEDLLHAKTILVDFDNPHRYEDAVREFERSLDTCAYFDNCTEYAMFLFLRHEYARSIILNENALTFVEDGEDGLRAGVLNDIGNAYNNIQQYASSEKAFQEALDILRRLSENDFDKHAVDLPSILNNQAIAYKNTGQYQEAKKNHLEALEIYKKIKERDPEAAVSEGIAVILSNLGVLYRDIQQHALSRENFEKALEIYRELSRQEPGMHESSMALTLSNLGNLYREVHQYPASMSCLMEALDVYQKLSIRNPDVFERAMASTTSDLGNLYADLRQYDLAVKHCLGSLEMRRKLCQRNPDVFELDLAMAVLNSGHLYDRMGQHEQAEKNYLEALEIFKKLNKRTQGAFESDEAMVLTNLGAMYKKMRLYEDSVKYSRQALKIFDELSVKNPDVFTHYVAGVLNNLGLVHLETEQYEQAEGELQQSLKIYRTLNDRTPGVYVPEVAKILYNLGHLYGVMHRYEPAEHSCQESLEIYRELSKHNPDAFGFEVAIGLHQLGILYRHAGRYEVSEKFYREAFDSCMAYHAGNPSFISSKRGVEILFNLVELFLLPAVAKKADARKYLLKIKTVLQPYREESFAQQAMEVADGLLGQLG